MSDRPAVMVQLTFDDVAALVEAAEIVETARERAAQLRHPGDQAKATAAAERLGEILANISAAARAGR